MAATARHLPVGGIRQRSLFVLAVVLAHVPLLALAGCRRDSERTLLPSPVEMRVPNSNDPPAPASAPASMPPAAANEPPPPPCGEEGQPECPLQRWMDENLNSALTTRSASRLSAGFVTLGGLAPEGYDLWLGFSEIGRAAADRGDMPGVKRTCAQCHEAYRERYRRDLRTRPLPPL